MGQPSGVQNTSFRIVCGGPGAGLVIDRVRSGFAECVGIQYGWIGLVGMAATFDQTSLSAAVFLGRPRAMLGPQCVVDSTGHPGTNPARPTTQTS